MTSPRLFYKINQRRCAPGGLCDVYQNKIWRETHRDKKQMYHHAFSLNIVLWSRKVGT